MVTREDKCIWTLKGVVHMNVKVSSVYGHGWNSVYGYKGGAAYKDKDGRVYIYELSSVYGHELSSVFRHGGSSVCRHRSETVYMDTRVEQCTWLQVGGCTQGWVEHYIGREEGGWMKQRKGGSSGES